MNQKLLTKLLASLLVMTLTFANFILLGVYAGESFATSDNLENQSTLTNNENVEFDAYFKDEKGNTTHTVRENMSKQDLKLYVSVQVKKGYLKNAKIQVLGENGTSSNLKVKSSNEILEYVESIDETTNSIKLKQINAGTQVVLEVPVVASREDIFDLSNFSKLNDVILTGTYVGDAGKEIGISKTIQTRNEWNENANPVLEQQLVRFIPYQVNEKTGTILQTLVKSGIENNVLPVEETKITLTVPTANGKNPSSVNVVPNGILSTNGMTQETFLTDNWTYDAQTGIVTITLRNENNENKVSWLKDGKDEFIVTYIYDEKVDTLETIAKANVEIKAYNSVETKVGTENELAISINEVLGQIVTANFETTQSLSKGYLYTKAERETGYNEKLTIDISYPELVDGLTIKQDADNFVNEAGEMNASTIGNINYAYYKTTKINKANFEKILGDQGSVKLVTLAGEEIVTFNKETFADENGDYVFNYTSETNQIMIVTTKPVSTGKLEIVHEKSLKGNTDYSREQLESFKSLRVAALLQAVAENTVIVNLEASKDITLVDPVTKFETSVSNQNLSTVVTNENVELRVILKTNDISCDLFKNPIVEIVLPNYISKLNIKDVNLLFDNELKIKDYNTYVNENGNIVIKVSIEGEQTVYNTDEISKGANLIINTDITLKQLTPTRDDVVKVYVTNELATSYEQMEVSRTRSLAQKGYSQTSLRAVAPIGMVTTNAISNYNSKNETVTSISSQEQVGKLDVKKEARTALVSMNVINNYQNVVNNMVVLGRIPTTGSKNVDTLEDFKSNLETQIASNISVSGVDVANVEIYYSTNIDATKDLNLASNGWTKTPENIANVKSYLIVVNGDILTGTTLGFSFGLAIPENLSYNVGAYSNYVVYFNNVKEEGTISEKAVATKVGIETGEGPELEVSISSDMEGKDIEEEQIITYTAKVKNIGKKELQNVLLSGIIPEKAIYIYFDGEEGTQLNVDKMYDTNVKEYSAKFDSLKPGEEKEITYQVETKEVSTITDEEGNEVLEEASVQAKAKATVEGYDAIFESTMIENKLIQGYLNVELKVGPIDETVVREQGDVVEYELMIKNVNSIPKNGVTVTAALPEGLTFKSVREPGIYNKEANTVTWNLETIEGYDRIYLYFEGKVTKVEDSISAEKITTNFTVKTQEKEINKSIDIIITAPKLVIAQSSETKEQVQEGETIVYSVIIKNVGSGPISNVKVVDVIEDGLILEDSQYSIGGNTYNIRGGDKEYILSIPAIEAKQSVEITLKMKADELIDGENSKVVSNLVKVITEEEEILSNVISHTIVPSSEVTDDPSTDVPQEGTYRISGVAWMDINNNGKRDDEEEKLANIPVLLINSENGQIVTDITTGKEKRQQTNENGEYTFANLKPGKYIVVFLYDSGNYGLAIYKNEGVVDNKNSDAIQMKVVLDGETRIAGVSDTITIINDNVSNIDIGLVESLKFDLRLDKTISKITETNNTESKVHEYKDEKLAKLDLKDKKVSETSIIVEYKLKVTNEGGVAGYAKKIVDYIPADMKFNSELNKDWYSDEKGNLYNSSLANTLILPGETKEITLLLTKKMTDSNLGIINNTAEIAESYNDLGLEDIDSKTSNKVQNEDDYSSADVIVGIKTGEVYLYITLSIIIVGILGVGIYLINKNVLNITWKGGR